MILTIDTTDSRDVKALELAVQADQWTALPLGGFRVPSSTGRGFYRTSAEICSCEDFGRHLEPCKHVRAVRIFLALREASGHACDPRLCGQCAEVEYLAPRPLCRAPGTRDRICAEYLGHSGAHSFVLPAVRED